MDTGVGQHRWPFGAPYGSALRFCPRDTFIHGGSYFDGISVSIARMDAVSPQFPSAAVN